MNKRAYQIMSAIALFALTLGSYSNAGASFEAAPQMAATTYYVSTTGKDTNAGTSAAPFKTIQKCANIAGTSNVCSVAAGTYSERVTVTRAGIVFQANGKVVIQGFVISTNNTTVDGFYSLSSTYSAGAFFVEGQGNIVRKNIIERPCMAGIVLNGKGNLAESNEIFKSRQCGGSGPDADGIRVFGDGHVIRGNYVHDISLAENPTAHIDCIQNWGTLLNTIIEGNTCNVVHAGIQTDVGNVHNITIRNNIFTASRPISLRGEGLKVTNNVFVGNATASYVFLQSSSNVTFQNNIIYNTSDGIITTVGTVTTGGYNIFYNSSGKAPRRDSGYSYVNGKVKWPTDKWQVNPMFVNPGTGDYHLKTGSPAIGAGAGGVDIGAFAFSGTSSASVPTATLTISSPTPTALSASATPVKTATAQASPTLAVSSPTPTALSASATPVKTATAQASPTPTALPASATPVKTATPVPVLPTSTSVPPTATVQQPAAETTYDDKNGSFVYSSDWKDVSIAAASGGSFKKTTEADSFVTFTFTSTGQSFSVLYTSGPNFGSIKVYIDNVLAGSIMENGSATVYQKRWNYSGQLPSGIHKLKFVATNPNGSIDAVIVR